jgi:hypothetical protein
MPISDEALQNEKNQFIAVRGDATVGQAVAALQAEGGQPWWHLLVQMDDGSWAVTRFTDLHQALEGTPTAAEIRLGGWPGLVAASAVEQDSMETRAAEAMARTSGGRVLVVTAGGLPTGILVEGVSRGATSISSAKLNELGGNYVNLKDYGSILLSSSRSGPGEPKPAASSDSDRS